MVCFYLLDVYVTVCLSHLLDLGPAIDPLPHRGNFVHYNFLKLHYIRNKMTHVISLAMRAFTCNSHVTNVTLKTIEIL